MPRRLYSKATHALRYFLLRRLPACKQMAELMSASLERKLTVRERVRLKLHLWVCAWCVWYLEQLRLLRSAVQMRELETANDSSTADDANTIATPDAPPEAARLSAEARERIKLALERTPR